MPAPAKRGNRKLNKATAGSTNHDRASKPSGLTQRKQAKHRPPGAAAEPVMREYMLEKASELHDCLAGKKIT